MNRNYSSHYLSYVFDWDDVDDVNDYLNEDLLRAPRTYIRDQENPLEMYDDRQFRRRFRFTKDTVTHILLPIVFPDQGRTSNKGLPVSPLLQLLVALRYYATASYQTVCGDLFKISQPSVHRISKFISETLCRQIAEFVRLPQTDAEIQKTWIEFYQKARFPGIIGLIDGTHIPIISPGGDQAEVFRNRKGYFSINVQVVCGPNEELFDIVCRWPGSSHDSRVFENSAIRVRLEQEFNRLGHLLGDAGYGQKVYLYTPLLNPTTETERKYNKAHKITRSLVERAIGRWKRRFPCLYFELQTKLSHTLRIIPACAILYNIGLRVGDIWTSDDDDLGPLNDDDDDVPTRNLFAAANPTSEAIRGEFIIRHFSN